MGKATDSDGGQYILIRPTRLGDVNLDGSVTIADFIDLASHFNGPGTWQEGDVNGDGQVSIGDFIDLASNFNTSYSGLSWAIAPQEKAMLAEFASSAERRYLSQVRLRDHGYRACRFAKAATAVTPQLRLRVRA